MVKLGVLQEGTGRLPKALLGNMTFLSLCALLIWLVLVHLLVNMWLFILSCGLLVVVGGWLGSQAVLGMESKVHLERFIKLSSTPQSPDCEEQLAVEIDSTIRKIIRDFVSSWYRTVSSDPMFEQDIQRAMRSMGEELKRRMEMVDGKALAQKVLLLCGCHLNSYMAAKDTMMKPENRAAGGERHSKELKLWQVYSKKTGLHPALQCPALEVDYARGIVDLLLHVLVPRPHLETRTGRFVVGELITCNVLLPLIAKLSDPDWINLILIHVISRTSKKGEAETQEQPHRPEVPTSLPFKVQVELPPESRPPPKAFDLSSYDVVDSVDYGCHETEESREELGSDYSADIMSSKDRSLSMDYLRPDCLKPLFLCEDLEPESPVCYMGKDTDSLVFIPTEEIFLDRDKDSLTPTEASSILEQAEGAGVDKLGLGLAHMLSSGPCPVVSNQSPRGPGPENLADSPEIKGERIIISCGFSVASSEHPGKCLSRQPSFHDKEAAPSETLPVDSLEPDSVGPLQTSSPTTTAGLSSFTFEPLSSPDIPVVIQHLRITGTITAREHRGTGSHPYTLYTIKYETGLDSENPGTLQQMAYHTVNRRYSEFLNLQTRLEEKAELRKLIKHVKGPKKLFPDLPFGNMDSDKVETRKVLLETFLQQLCAIPEITNCEEMQEFLALNTDARIAFVKKPFVVSRIDKMVVSAIVDTLKTAFPRSEPQSPTEELGDSEVDGRSQVDGRKLSRPRLRFSVSKIAPVPNVASMLGTATYCYDEGASVLEGLSLVGIETFIQEKERVLDSSLWQLPLWKPSTATVADESEASKLLEGQALQAENQSENVDMEIALADMALDLVCLLMKKHWSWLCAENLQRAIRMVFGTLIDRWLEVQVVDLLCTQRWILYLRALQEAIWPGGSLPARPKPVRTQEQKEKAREQALHCLMGILPDWIPEVLGVDKYSLTWELVLESLQDPTINRHLVYCLWDLLLEFLIPECSCKDFQKSILARIPGNTEKGGV